MQEIAEKIHGDKSTVTVLVRRLEQVGLVRRSADWRDRRRTQVALTDSGRSLRRPLLATHERLQRSFSAGLSQTEQAQLISRMARRSNVRLQVNAAPG